jgi:hypothetical protein
MSAPDPSGIPADQVVRLECLKLAHQRPAQNPDETLALAKLYAKFVRDSVPDTPTVASQAAKPQRAKT